MVCPANNSQFGFLMTAPTSTLPYGISVDFTVPSGVTNVAGTSTGKWCTAGNLIAEDGTGNYAECSITYFAAGGGQPSGWYFWYGWNGVGSYISLGTAPTSDNVTLQLQWNGSQWQATLTDHSHSGNNKLAGIGGSSKFSIAYSYIWFENGGNTTCSNYSSWGSTLTFSNLKYYDINGTAITYTNTISSSVNCNVPNTCTGGTACISESTSASNLTITRNC